MIKQLEGFSESMPIQISEETQMDKILKIDEDTVVDISQVEGISRNKDSNNTTIFMKSGEMFIREGIMDYSSIVNRWANFIEGA